jgi:5-methylcytosine-specific restriction endonuclease McrA
VVKSTEWQREQYQNNPEFRERMKQHNKRWYDEQDGKGYYHVRNQKRRSRISELEYNFTENDWTKALVYFNYSCAYCGAVVTTGAHQDHVVPLANGGTYTPDNIVPACKSCNCSKGAKELEDWYKTKPFFNEHKLQRIIDFITKNKIDRDLKSE